MSKSLQAAAGAPVKPKTQLFPEEHRGYWKVRG